MDGIRDNGIGYSEHLEASAPVLEMEMEMVVMVLEMETEMDVVLVQYRKKCLEL